MTDAPSWNGYPERPDLAGWHWLFSPETRHTVVKYWRAEALRWFTCGCQDYRPNEIAAVWNYIGPCLIPAEVAAREREAELRGFEAAVALPWWGDLMRAELARRRAEEGT